MKKATYFYLLRRGFFGGGALSVFVQNYEARVLADGGAVEKLNCVQRAIAGFPAGPSFGASMFSQYSTRVVGDGGTAEGQACAENDLNYLYENFTSY